MRTVEMQRECVNADTDGRCRGSDGKAARGFRNQEVDSHATVVLVRRDMISSVLALASASVMVPFSIAFLKPLPTFFWMVS
jgi:hypothetical protein